MSLPLVLLLAAMGVGRLIRLVVADTIFDRPRLWWSLHLPEFWVEMLGCGYCVSAWLTAPVTVGIAWTYHSWAYLCLWPALWHGSIVAWLLVESLAASAKNRA